MKSDGKQKKKKKKKKKKEKKRNYQPKKKLGPLQSADKKFASWAKKKKRKKEKKKKGKLHLHMWADFATAAASSNFDCNNARCWNPLCWPWACCASNCTLLAALPCFFRSTYVRATTLLSIPQARKWFPSLWSLKSKSPVISTWLSKESALPGGLVARGELPPPRYGCRRLLASPRAKRIQTFASYLSLLPLHADLPWKVLVVSNRALLKKQSLQRRPTAAAYAGSSIDRWIRKC